MKAMRLSKLKITVCVTVLALMAFAGANGTGNLSVAEGEEKKSVYLGRVHSELEPGRCTLGSEDYQDRRALNADT